MTTPIPRKPDAIATDIRLKRDYDQDAGSFLIVEGETDARFYERFTDEQRCKIIVASSKEYAMSVLKMLEQELFAGVLAIVDADFWVLEGSYWSSPNLLLTDTHDLETMILQSPALERLIAEYTNKDKETEIRKNIRPILLEAGKHIGYLRWISKKDNLFLTFDGLNFKNFLDEGKLTVDIADLIKTVKNKSSKHGLLEQEIKDSLGNLKDVTHDPWHVCCGHDLVELLSFSFRKALTLRKVNQDGDRPDTKPDTLGVYLRLAYDDIYFCGTQLYNSIRGWEDTNRPFRVLSMALLDLCK